MYRLKYYSLNKDEKTKLKEDYYKTDLGKNVKIRLNRVFIYGIMGILFSILIFLTDKTIAIRVFAGGLFVVSTIFIISSYRLRIKKLNEYLVKKK